MQPGMRLSGKLARECVSNLTGCNMAVVYLELEWAGDSEALSLCTYLLSGPE